MLIPIQNSSELSQFLAKKNPLSHELKLNFSTLSQTENTVYSRKVNEYRAACGCQLGSYFMIGALLCCLVFGLIQQSISWEGLGGSIGFVFLCAVAGKLLGKGVARYRLMKLVQRLTTREA